MLLPFFPKACLASSAIFPMAVCAADLFLLAFFPKALGVLLADLQPVLFGSLPLFARAAGLAFSAALPSWWFLSP